MERVPKHYCKDCDFYIKMPRSGDSMCRAEATLTREPVEGRPIWRNLRHCIDHREATGGVECPQYKEAADE